MHCFITLHTSPVKEVVQVYEVKVKTVVAKQGNKIVIESANQLKSSQEEARSL